ncbi:MAG: acyclic terpene utilization AtuA family protein [Kofleriaceae bacterium]
MQPGGSPKSVTLGSGSGYWGDALEPAIEMAARADVSYMGFDHLSELTMAILSRSKAKDPAQGYIPDLIPWMRALLPVAVPRGIRLITNAGGANPRSAAAEVAKLARELGMPKLRIGIVEGDDVLGRLPGLRDQGWTFTNLDTGEQGLDRIGHRIVAANAYLGSDGIIAQLAAGADVVITGRVSDNALYVAPIMHELGWTFSPAYTDRIAAAITVGHVIECAACVTGGMSNMWKLTDPSREIGFPIAEFFETGDAVITKTPDSGGVVNEWTVKEHLLYEIGDPRAYVMPDGVADFTSVKLIDEGRDRVRLSNMRGAPRPQAAKVCIAYKNGFIGEGMAFFPWPDAYDKAQFAATWMRARLERLGLAAHQLHMDFVGVDMLHGDSARGHVEAARDANEIGLRVAAHTEKADHAEMIRREITHLWTMGPVGSAIAPPSKVRPVISLWPTLVPWEAAPTVHDQIVAGGA